MSRDTLFETVWLNSWVCIYKKPGFGFESCCSYIIEYSLLYKNKSNWYKQKYIVEHNNQIVSHTHTILTWRNSEVTRITVIQNLILLFLIYIQYSNYQLFLNCLDYLQAALILGLQNGENLIKIFMKEIKLTPLHQ